MSKALALLLSLVLHGLGLLLLLLAPLHERVPFGTSLEVVAVPSRGMRAQTKAAPSAAALDKEGDKVVARAAKALAPSLATGREESRVLGDIGVSDGTRASAKERYLYELRLYLDQNKKFPMRARALRQSGRVLVAFQVGEDGSFHDVHLLTESPFASLNEEALELFRRLERFRPIPDELRGKAIALEVPIEFRLD